MSTQDVNGADLFAPSHGCISAVEIHDHLPQQSSLERGDIKTKPERPILNELHLFAGCGGGILGGILLGHHPVCAVEIEPYCRRVLLQRQRDGVLPRFPIWDDVRTFDGKPWRGRVDVVCGGFPCQDISTAGKGAGLTGARSGLWAEMRRVIGEVEPRFAFVENSPMLTLRGLGVVLGELAEMGFDAEWGVMGACDAGAPHERERIWILADSNKNGCSAAKGCEPNETLAKAPQRFRDWEIGVQSRAEVGSGGWWRSAPPVCRVADGLASDMDRIAALGNGQVPAVAALAWRVLSESARLQGMRVGLPKGKAPASEGRKYNDALCEAADKRL